MLHRPLQQVGAQLFPRDVAAILAVYGGEQVTQQRQQIFLRRESMRELVLFWSFEQQLDHALNKQVNCQAALAAAGRQKRSVYLRNKVLAVQGRQKRDDNRLFGRVDFGRMQRLIARRRPIVRLQFEVAGRIGGAGTQRFGIHAQNVTIKVQWWKGEAHMSGFSVPPHCSDTASMYIWILVFGSAAAFPGNSIGRLVDADVARSFALAAAPFPSPPRAGAAATSRSNSERRSCSS